MNRKIILASLVLIVGFMAVLYSNNRRFDRSEEPQLLSQEELNTQTNSEGAVDIEVTPLDISKSSDTWKFEIAMNTHSVTLDQDLTKVSVLKDEKGKEYSPTSWEGAPPGGHHREGTLVFAPITSKSKELKLVIKGIGEIPERIFTWKIRG